MTNKPAWAEYRPFKVKQINGLYEHDYIVVDCHDSYFADVQEKATGDWIVAALNGEGQESVGEGSWYDLNVIGKLYPLGLHFKTKEEAEAGRHVRKDYEADKLEVVRCRKTPSEPATPSTPSPCLEALIKDYEANTPYCQEERASEARRLVEAARNEAAGRAVPWCRSPQKAASGIRNAFGLAIAFGKPLPTEEKIVEIIQHCQGNAPIPPPDRSEELEKLKEDSFHNELNGESIMLAREHLKAVGIEAIFFDDTVKRACDEITELRHRSTGLKAKVDVKKCAEEIVNRICVDAETEHSDKRDVEAILNKYLNRGET